MYGDDRRRIVVQVNWVLTGFRLMESVTVLCFDVRYFMSILVLQSS